LRSESLEETGIGNKVRALIKLRCSKLEMANKYWLEKRQWICLFCKKKRDNIEHYVRECREVKEWFIGMGLKMGGESRQG